ncbi:uncharacterized protein BDW70DRAFT_142780 [Aspergillus foveolatus]|uniref:uncharacterized protein n=1 Tax=Aspergillus foveolatus TaxID=210207 RepID=UPI003CCD78DA
MPLAFAQYDAIAQQIFDHSLTRCLTCDTVACIGPNHQMVKYPTSSSNISFTG